MAHRLFSVSLVLAMTPITAAYAADRPEAPTQPATQREGTLGLHPAVRAHLLAMKAAESSTSEHPTVLIHSRMLGSVRDEAAAPHVEVAFGHVARNPRTLAARHDQ